MKSAARQKKEAQQPLPPCIIKLELDVRELENVLGAHARWTGESGAALRNKIIAQAQPQVLEYNKANGQKGAAP